MTDLDQKALWPGWETVRVIGRGSFGAVYEIRREMFGETEKAALKLISIPQSSSDIDELYGEGYDEASITSAFREHLKSIVAEYSLMRKLNGSANVVNCDDVRYVQHEDGIGWDILIKMELLTPLTKALDQLVTDEQAIRVGSDLCKALILCRKHSIIHRDIKPANIFVSENGDYKLGDFGIAKTVEKTSGGTKIGTYEYMAPEVYHDRPYGAAADIYSLGMVLYWLLNERRTPFLKLPPILPTNSEKEQARKRRFRGEPLPAPAHGSPELQRIVLKACAYDPAERYQSADDMLRDLERAEYERKKGDFDPAHNEPTDQTAWPEPSFDPEKNEIRPLYGPPPFPPEEMDSTAGAIPESPAPLPEEATVGAFGAAGTVTPPAEPAGVRHDAPAAPPVPEPEEEGTLGVFGAPQTAQTAATPGTPQKQEPDPEEEATVGLFKQGQTKQEKKEKKAEKAAKQEEPAKNQAKQEESKPKSEKPEKPAAEKKSGGKGKLIGILAAAVVVIAAAVLLILNPFGKSAPKSAAPASTPKPAATSAPAATPKPTAKPTATPKPTDESAPQVEVIFVEPIYDYDGENFFSAVHCNSEVQGNGDEVNVYISFGVNFVDYVMNKYPGYYGEVHAMFFPEGQTGRDVSFEYEYRPTLEASDLYTFRLSKQDKGVYSFWVEEFDASGNTIAYLEIGFVLK
jgi:serine/threonine protein kinase